MRRSYTARLILAFAAVGAAGALITALVVNVAFGDLLGGYLDQQQLARQDQIVNLLAASYARNGSWNTSDLDALAPSMVMSGAEVSVEDADGRSVWDLRTSPGRNVMGGMMRPGMMGGSALGPVQRLPVVVGGVTVGTAVIQLPAAASVPANAAFRDSVNLVLLVGGLAAGLLAIGLGFVLARRATEPVRELTRRAQQLAAGDRSVRVEHRSDDEFGAMAESFNAMADSIAEEDDLRRTFAADVAHELRTPLMILSSQLEAMEDGVVELGPGAVASLREEAQRMTRLVSDLEVLATADAAHFSMTREPTDLGEEVHAAVSEYRMLFAEKRIRVDLETAVTPINGDPARLRQIAGNLLSNALKFTPTGGKVRVSVTADSAHAILEVADSGPGIPEDEMTHLFERFFRGRAAAAAGSGIGLTVVRDLVRAHGGEVSAANGATGGAVFRITLPLASQKPANAGTTKRRAEIVRALRPSEDAGASVTAR
jgi:signal transduction histidine kinase